MKVDASATGSANNPDPTNGATGGYGGGGGGGDGGQGGFGGGGGANNGADAFNGGGGGFGGGGGGGGLYGEGGAGGFGAGDGTDGVDYNSTADDASASPALGGGGLRRRRLRLRPAGRRADDRKRRQLRRQCRGRRPIHRDGLRFRRRPVLQGDNTISLAPTRGHVTEVGDIADEAGSESGYATQSSGLEISGEGVVQLSGDNTYTGDTVVGTAAGAEAYEDGDVSGNGALELTAAAFLDASSTIVLYNGATLTLDAGSYFAGTIDISHVTDPVSVKINIEPGAIFEGVFALTSTSSNGDVLTGAGFTTTVAPAQRYYFDGTALFELTPTANGLAFTPQPLNAVVSDAATNFTILSAADINSSSTRSRHAGCLPGRGIRGAVVLAVDSAAAPQAETQSTDVIIPDIAGREAPVIEADGASSVIGRGDMELAEGGRPLTFSAGQGQTLTVDSNIFDPLAYTLSGDIDPNSAVVSEPTPKQNLAASQWTSFGQIQVTDSLDRTYLLDVYLTKTSANDWEVDVFNSAAAPANGGFPYTSGPLATDQLVYSNGQLQSGGSFAVTTPDGGTIKLDLSSVAEANATISGNLSSDATIVSGSTPTANLTTSAYSAELSLNVVNTMGVSEAIDLYFTQTTANAWRAAAFAGSTTPGVFPYAGAPLADETLTFDASGAVASGGGFFIAGAKGADVTLDLSSLIENSRLTSLLATPISQQTSIDGNLSVTAASDTGSLPSNDVSGSTYTTELTLDALSETGATTRSTYISPRPPPALGRSRPLRQRARPACFLTPARRSASKR